MGLDPLPPSTCVHLSLTPSPLRVDVMNGWPCAIVIVIFVVAADDDDDDDDNDDDCIPSANIISTFMCNFKF